MAARWIGEHTVRQQSAFNQTAIQFNSELVRWQDANLRRIRRLEEQVRCLEARLAEVEQSATAAQGGEDRD
jgi:hypothetical protein